jgi:hypothetical protein
VSVKLFDYRFTTGGGKNSKTHRQTVIAFESAQLDLDGFTIRPNQFFDAVRERFGKKSIDMRDEAFDGRFNVYAHQDGQEDAVRELVTADLRYALLNQDGRSIVEGAGNRLLVWRQGDRVAADQVLRAIEEAMRLYKKVAATSDWSWQGQNKETLSFDDRGWRKPDKNEQMRSSDDGWDSWKK